MGSISLGAGWLEVIGDTKTALIIHDVEVPRWSKREQAIFPTRIEEYSFVADALAYLKGGYVVDAGAGFNPEIHLMAEIAANMDFDVIAIDANESSLVVPARPGIVRYRGDLTQTPVLDATADAWICVSTLEHLPRLQQMQAVQEAFRILKPGGLAIATADELEPFAFNALFAAAGFETGAVQPFEGQHLTPRVAWVVAQKPAVS